MRVSTAPFTKHFKERLDRERFSKEEKKFAKMMYETPEKASLNVLKLFNELGNCTVKEIEITEIEPENW